MKKLILPVACLLLGLTMTWVILLRDQESFYIDEDDGYGEYQDPASTETEKIPENSNDLELTIQKLHHEDPYIRNGAAGSLLANDKERYVGVVAKLLDDPEARVRSQVVYLLGEYKAIQYENTIVQLLEDPSRSVQHSALGALERLGVLAKYPDKILERVLRGDSSVKAMATRILQEHKIRFEADVLYEKFKSAVVKIEVKTNLGKTLGTGFFVTEQGHILTNAHVLEPEEGEIEDVIVTLHNGHRVKTEGEFHVHHTEDLAVIRATEGTHLYFDMGPRRPRTGEQVIVIGHPLGHEWSLTQGSVSQIREEEIPVAFRSYGRRFSEWIQTDTAINPGNSGGPLLDFSGNLQGIVTSKKVGKGVEGLGFALSTITTQEWYWKEKSDRRTVTFR